MLSRPLWALGRSRVVRTIILQDMVVNVLTFISSGMARSSRLTSSGNNVVSVWFMPQ